MSTQDKQQLKAQLISWLRSDPKGFKEVLEEALRDNAPRPSEPTPNEPVGEQEFDDSLMRIFDEYDDVFRALA